MPSKPLRLSTHQQGDAVFREIAPSPRPPFRVEITIQERLMRCMIATFNFICRKLAAASQASNPPPTTTIVFSDCAISRKASASRIVRKIDHVAQTDAGDCGRTGRLPIARHALLNSIVSPFPSTARRRSILNCVTTVPRRVSILCACTSAHRDGQVFSAAAFCRAGTASKASSACREERSRHQPE